MSQPLRHRHSWEFPGGPVVETRAFTAAAQVQSLVRELRSHKQLGEAKTSIKKKQKPQTLRAPCSPARSGGPHKLSPPPPAASGRTLAWGTRAGIRSEQLSKSSGESTSCWAP